MGSEQKTWEQFPARVSSPTSYFTGLPRTHAATATDNGHCRTACGCDLTDAQDMRPTISYPTCKRCLRTLPPQSIVVLSLTHAELKVLYEALYLAETSWRAVNPVDETHAYTTAQLKMEAFFGGISEAIYRKAAGE